MVAMYIGRDDDPKDPKIYPLYGDFQGLPSLLIMAGSSEVLLDDAKRCAEKANHAGVDVTFPERQDMVHVWPIFCPTDFPERTKRSSSRVNSCPTGCQRAAPLRHSQFDSFNACVPSRKGKTSDLSTVPPRVTNGLQGRAVGVHPEPFRRPPGRRSAVASVGSAIPPGA